MGTYARAPGLGQDQATTVVEPPDLTEGNWVGAPALARHRGTTLLAVRERTPAERGRQVTIYAGTDGERERVVELTAASLDVVSVERVSMVVDRTDRLHVYVPVDHGDNEWTIQKLAPVRDPAALDPTTAHTVLGPRAGGSDSVTVKDPVVTTVGGRHYMFYAGHDGISEQAHLATSVDGETWERHPDNPVLGRQYWHDHHTRISAVVPAPDAPVWQVFYEGSGTVDYGQTWNLRTGMAISHDLTDVNDTTPDGPLYTAPTANAATGVDEFATLRYLTIEDSPDRADRQAYYEVARQDGAFELRRAPLTDD